MNYVIFTNTVFSLIYTLLGLLICHFIIFAVVGVFFNKKYPKAEKKLRYGLVIPARNEEKVIANLIKSVQASSYPQDKLEIFLIAHNCTDRTAEIGREMGIHVYEYNNPSECTKGYAFKYLFNQIEKDFGTQSFDGFIVFDADNIVCEDYFDKLNDAFVAGDRKNVVITFRNSKNFGSNVISALYGLHFMYGCRYECRGRTVLGCSTRVQGTGYVISNELVKDGWKYVTLTEDWEFSTDQVIAGQKIYYCDDAVFYDEQPTSFRIMWRQKVRWARGHFLVFFTRYKDILKAQFTPKKKGGCPNKGSLHDIAINILPLAFLATMVTVFQVVALLSITLFNGINQGLIYDFGSAVSHIWTYMLSTYLRNSAFGFIGTYLTLLIPSIVIYIIERKRIKNVSLGIKIGSTLLWPFFLAIYIFQEVQAVFSPKLGWKEIPHHDTTDFEALNEEDANVMAHEDVINE